jgi:cardiolipin synthase
MPPRFDYAVRVEGPMLGDIYPVVRRLWWIVRASQLRYRRGRPDALASNQGQAGTVRAAFVFRDNLYHRRDIEQEYLRALAEAKGEAIIANAYFFPGREFRHALVDAARRGVRVTLLLQGKVEYFLLHYATRALYGTLLNAGVEIIEYHKSFLHAKVAVIDGEWATVGSSNIDPFSLLLAREANVFVRDKDFAGQLRESLQRAMELGATPVVRQMWRGRSWPERALTWVCYGAARLLMGLVGYGKRWDA